ncbi:MAG: protease pro-enzyme activation domain-containing protein, partial [Mycobacteriales bacterium]
MGSALVAVLAAMVGLPAAVGAASSATSGSVAMARTVAGPLPRALPASARQVGPLLSTTPLHLSVVLPSRDPAALAQFASDVSTPGNSLYRHYLAHGQFGGLFGAAPSVLTAVRSWLVARGLQPGPTTGNDLSIPLVATAGAVSVALHTSFEQVRLASGRLAYRDTMQPEIPAGVQAVLGLDDIFLPRPLGFAGRSLARPGPAPRAVEGRV